MRTRPSTLHLAIAVTLATLVAGCNKPVEAPATRSPDTAPAGANVSDIDITTNVKTALLHDGALKGADIGVVVLKGDVRVIGVLDSQAQIDTALRIARAADGVHSIHDELTLRK